jgi:hypothetical protein
MRRLFTFCAKPGSREKTSTAIKMGTKRFMGRLLDEDASFSVTYVLFYIPERLLQQNLSRLAEVSRSFFLGNFRVESIVPTWYANQNHKKKVKQRCPQSTSL